MDKDIIKNIIASLIVSAIASTTTYIITAKQNTINIERNTKAIEEVKRDYATRRELDLKIASLERTVNRIDRNVDKLTQLLLNINKYNN
ncbi:hypothetical protein SAMN02745174_02225 [Cetobacterium ceti]|uniref:Uncharacterized protein n=1 Tax=Cetobacterium ceti TaxID=180163 RepID=A0A1T4Q8D3_9FUSO|nr:hypothetical protein [Cetobacterium ceti]SJZ99945.1 hypothetical protein SAMN02745174_02225 [Cetobacterium ceti]